MALTQIDDRGLKTPIDLLDGEKIRLGTDNDIQIHHTSGSNYIEGALRIGKNDNVRITDAADNTIIGTNATSAYLAYEGTTKLETTSGGIEISGTTATQKLTATNTYAADNTTQCGYQVQNLSDTTDTYAALRLTTGSSSPATAQIASVRKGTGQNDITFQLEASNTAKEVMRLTSAGNVDILNDTGKLRLGTDADLQIFHNGAKSWIEGHNGNVGIAVDSGNDNAIDCIANGAVELFHSGI